MLKIKRWRHKVTEKQIEHVKKIWRMHWRLNW
jgi:hypothetical protein